METGCTCTYMLQWTKLSNLDASMYALCNTPLHVSYMYNIYIVKTRISDVFISLFPVSSYY